MAGNSLRIESVTAHQDGRIEFLLQERNAPLDVATHNDTGVIFSSRQHLKEELDAFQQLFNDNPQYKLFLLLAQSIKDDPQMRSTTIATWSKRTITVDASSPAKVIST